VRITADRYELEAAPGEATSFVVDVVNTADVIDGITARVIGQLAETIACQPALLPLFPDSAGQFTVTVNTPLHLPAGRHPIVVEFASHGAQVPPQYLELFLVVLPRPQLELNSQPKVAKGRRSGRFVLDVRNPGNVRLQVDLRASDASRQMEFQFSSDRIVVDPGRSAPAVLNVRARRRLTGSEFSYNLSVEAVGQRVDLPAEWYEPEEEPLEASTELQLKQKPLISRGLVTAFMLASIVALWAAAFLFGIAKVFATDPPKKEAPVSFFWLKGVTQVGTANAAFNVNTAVIPGTLPRNGELPAGEGSQITGSVTGWVDRQPVGRILVEAYRLKNGITPDSVGAAGTQADGTFAIAGLFPTSYYLKFSAKGYRSVWYSGTPEGASSMHDATLIHTLPQSNVRVKNVVMHGKPATIRGSVDLGETSTPVDYKVTARLMLGSAPQGATYTADVDLASKEYVLKRLPAPASYELTFTADGYESSAIVEAVAGGDVRYEPATALSAGEGQISGQVSNEAGLGIGAVTVSTMVNGTPVSVVTPTVGTIGNYTLQNLPVPGTYVVTFSQPDYGSRTKIVNLGVGPDAVNSHVNVHLVAGTGSVSGIVVDLAGQALGAVTLAVGGTSLVGSTATPSTTTLTGGARGTFQLNGLAVPGTYTLTATLPGYEPRTKSFQLREGKKPPYVKIKLAKTGGSIGGFVSGPCPEAQCGNAKVSATDGRQVWTVGVTAAGTALDRGLYVIGGLPSGTYTVTVADAGMIQQTALVTVADGKRTPQDLELVKAT
jgi:hypothetical protein